MQLKEFVKATLTEIATGIKEAQEEVKDSDMIINPSGLASNERGEKYLRSAGLRYVQDVEITVGLKVDESSEGRAGIGIAAGIFGAGAQTKANAGNESVSSVRFSVPVALPSTKTPDGYDKRGKAKGGII